ncbi:MAG: hypothetical protein ACI8TQ_000227 [Planctomycetota bacterium]|jgi:hypothetical protein
MAVKKRVSEMRLDLGVLLRADQLASPGIRLLALLLLGCFSSCVSSDADIHLAPLYTRLSSAGGGTKSEALFGAVIAERDRHDGPLDAWALRPLVGWEREPDGPSGPTPLENSKSRTEFLYPLGSKNEGVRSSSNSFFPIYTYHWRKTKDGERWTLLTLPGFWFARDSDGGSSTAWFPIAGHVEDFLTYDTINFFLFPLYANATRGEAKSQHFLYPILGWTFGGGESSHRFWPLYTHAEIDGVYDRTSVLWPIFHWQTNGKFLGADKAEHMWMVWPLFGKTRRQSFKSYSVAWPFFGYATDPRADFWALDAPWPLVRIQRGGQNPAAEERTRVWPFFSHFRGDRLESWNYAWPLVHKRKETYPLARRDSFYFLPFWQSWRRTDEETGTKTSWKKAWPFYQRRIQNGRNRFSSLAPFPFHFDERFDFYWAWPFELWTSEEQLEEQIRSERAWGGLWRREVDRFEDRRSLTGLWSNRSYREAGRNVSETSLLFGLLRWRSIAGEGNDLMMPAFPGPGWPAVRHTEPLDDAPLPPLAMTNES